MKCENFPSYQEFSKIVLSAPPRSYRAWLIKLKNAIGNLPDEIISECIEKLYHIPRQLYPQRIYPIVRYRNLLMEIYEHLKNGGSLNAWCKSNGITYKTAWEILRIFGFRSVHELKSLPSKESLFLISPRHIPWSDIPLSSKESFITVTIPIERDLWDEIKRKSRQEKLSPELLVNRILKKSLNL